MSQQSRSRRNRLHPIARLYLHPRLPEPAALRDIVLSAGLWKRLLPLLALIKAGAGLVALMVAHGHIKDGFYPWYLHAVYAVPFLSTGLLLIFGGRRDDRAVSLGG